MVGLEELPVQRVNAKKIQNKGRKHSKTKNRSLIDVNRSKLNAVGKVGSISEEKSSTKD